MTPASKKAKGRKLQQDVCKIILEEFPCLEEDDVLSTSMGANGVDIKLSPAALKKVPLAIECKSLNKMVLYNWYEQSTSNAKKGTEPIVVAKANRKKPLVIVDAEYFFKLMGLTNG